MNKLTIDQLPPPLTKEECDREGIAWWNDRIIYDESGDVAVIKYPNKEPAHQTRDS